MAFKAGKDTYLGLDNAAGAVQNISAFADSAKLPIKVEMLDVSSFGSSVKRFIPALVDGGALDISGALDSTLHSQIAGMLSAQAAGTAGFSMLYGPGGSVTGLVKQTAEVYVASYEVSSSVSGRSEFSASLQVDGAVTNGTW